MFPSIHPVLLDLAFAMPRLCSKLAPVWLITADIFPNDLEMSVDDTLNEFDTSLTASMICSADSAPISKAVIWLMIKLAASPASIASSATF